ncbi:MAG: Hsp20 family protein, partial [Caldimonas sp.]
VTIDGRRLSVETVEPASEAKPDGDATDKNPAGEKPAIVAAERVLYRERTAARYARTVVLPAEVEQTGSEARFENGVLSLTLVKKVPTGARQISIS